jgi:type I restriction enzyme S subunit
LATLGDICEIYQPKTISKKEMSVDGVFPVFGANGVIGRHDQYNHEEPQVLVTCRGATCGRVNVSEPRSWITGNAMVVRAKEGALAPRFLFYFLQGAVDWNSVITGAAQPQITRKSLAPVKVSYPPLEEQHRIVEILDAAFEGLDRARENVDANLTSATKVYEGFLDSEFESLASRDNVASFGDVCSFVRGPFGGSLKKSIFKPSGYAVYEQRHAIHRDFDAFRYFIDEEKFQEMDRFHVASGDLIMSCSGTMGKVAIVPNGSPKGVINQALLKLSVGPKSSGEYVRLWMQSGHFLNQLTDNTRGVAIKNIASVKALKALRIPLPEGPIQQRLVESLARVERRVSDLSGSYEAERRGVLLLRQSLLEKAFAGELT